MAKQDKVYKPETIPEQPLPTEQNLYYGTSQHTSNQVYDQKKIENRQLPSRRRSYEVLSSVLNTKSKKILGEFELVDQGAFRVGKYENGVSGDVRMTPDGIVARNLAGLITFLLNGDDGSAYFRGTVQAGSIISEARITGETLLVGLIAVGSNNIILDGENNRILVNDDTTDRVLIGEY